MNDNASIFSGASSLSDESIDTKIEKRKRDIQGLINNSKHSTAPFRREIKLLSKIQELQYINQQQAEEIKQLKTEQTDNIPANSLNIKQLGKSVERLETLIELSKK
jgi:hypothetical protein